ncbi:hypothetical protein [Candidatus Uabimicrobium sp. HlEnr_7]|uniref:hypothetical protein n=1 Tax=Candidatus Uabimicrobium helgolandensis TaxID=3095367 RepID=UPI0035582022
MDSNNGDKIFYVVVLLIVGLIAVFWAGPILKDRYAARKIDQQIKNFVENDLSLQEKITLISSPTSPTSYVVIHTKDGREFNKIKRQIKSIVSDTSSLQFKHEKQK